MKKQKLVILGIFLCIFLANCNLFQQPFQYYVNIPRTSAGIEEIGQFYDGGQRSWDVELVGSIAYVADGWGEDSTGEMEVIDVSDPTNPIEIGRFLGISPGGSISNFNGLAISGSYAYITDFYYGFWIVDISDPTSPIEVARLDDGGNPKDVCVRGSYAYVAEYSGLEIIDISNPSIPIEVSQYSVDAVYDVFVEGTYAYLATLASGMQIVDVSDPTNPIKIGQYGGGGGPDMGDQWGVYVSGSYAYIADEEYGLVIVDVTNPALPTEIGRYWDSGGNYGAYGVYVEDSYAYAAWGNQGLKIIDISDPTNPTLIAQQYDGGWAYDVSVNGSYFYVADGTDGLEILKGDVVPPEYISTPQDMQFDETNSQEYLEWTVFDSNPSSLMLLINGTEDLGFDQGWRDTVTCILGAMTPGDYNYTLVATDIYGNLAQDTVFVTVLDAYDPILHGPVDLEYIEGDTGNFLSWIACDTNPSQYVVYQNSIEIQTDDWESHIPITISVDGLDPDIYEYTIEVYDGSGRVATDSVFVTVAEYVIPDTKPPDVSALMDLEIVVGSSEILHWDAFDEHPGTYVIHINSILDTEDTWNVIDGINYNLDQLDPGENQIALFVYDENMNYAIDSVYITVLESLPDITPPELPPLKDVYMVNGSDEVLEWDPVDNNPGMYELYFDGMLEIEDMWTVEHGINFSLSELEPGEYLVTLIVYDESMNYAIDSVYLIIENADSPIIIPGFNIWVFLGVVSVMSIIIIRRLQKKTN